MKNNIPDKEGCAALMPYCGTDRQRDVLNALAKAGTARGAARTLGVTRQSVQSVIEAVQRRAAAHGFAPDRDLNYPLPVGQTITGTSTLIDKETGRSVMQWVKTKVDDAQREEIMRAVFVALAEELPQYEPIDALATEAYTNPELLNLYVLTDYHLGMKSWHEETGADWDLEIAENMLVDWFAAAIMQSPQADLAVFAQLGDFLHWDGMDAVTPQHRHLLDADTRFQKLVRVAIRVIRRIINMLLSHHKHVHILMADANHDPASSAWLREWLASVYADELRISVDTSADTYYCVEHGDTVLFFHHGHKRRVADVDRVFAGKHRQAFGRAKHAYAHLGHLHSNEVKESQLMIVERHRTLAAPDAYAAKGGWISGREAKVITYHKTFGEVSRTTINPEMIARKARK